MATTTLYSLDDLSKWAKARDLALMGVDFTPVLKQCSVAIRADAMLNFQSSSDPDGNAWPPLARPRPNSKGTDQPLLDRGLLRGSVTGAGANSFQELTPHSLAQGSNLIYARLQQEGGTVVPKHAKALTIPLSKLAMRKPAREIPGLFRPKGMNVLAAAKQGKSKKFQGPTLEFHFALVGAVRIPARPFLGFGRRLRDTLDTIIGEWVAKWESK